MTGYYMEESSEKELFEYLQQDLERSTENLHGLVEAPAEKLDRQKILKQTALSRNVLILLKFKFCENLLKGDRK